jgi:3D (Asp-Asp-Asp) domain-containing protein
LSTLDNYAIISKVLLYQLPNSEEPGRLRKGKNKKEKFLEGKRFRILVLVCVFLLSFHAQGCQRGDLRVPAKVDEPISRGDRNVVQYDEPIPVGRNNKGAKEIYSTELRKKERKSYYLCEKNPLEVKKVLKVRATGYYTPVKGQKRYAFGSFEADLRMNGKGNMTASGKKPEAGKTVAVDKSVIPHGTRLKIEGYPGIFEAQDSGKDIKGKRIDIYFGKGEKALEKALAVNSKKFITVEVVVPHS